MTLAAVSVSSIPVNEAFGYGEAGIAPTCGARKPGTPTLIVVDSSQPNSAILYWTPADDATHYTIAYGLSSGNYIYGLPRVYPSQSGYTPRSYTINHLANGVRYYFVVRAVNDCRPGDFSNELGLVTGQETIAMGYTARRIRMSQINSVLGAYTQSGLPTPRPTNAPRQLGGRVLGDDTGPTMRPTPRPTPVITPRPPQRPPAPSPAPAPRGFLERLRSLFSH